MTDDYDMTDEAEDNEVREYIEHLEAENARLREALALAAASMTCNGHDGMDAAHYCPNCDNSMYGNRERIRAALEAKP